LSVYHRDRQGDIFQGITHDASIKKVDIHDISAKERQRGKPMPNKGISLPSSATKGGFAEEPSI
jgi:hypothetical protein